MHARWLFAALALWFAALVVLVLLARRGANAALRAPAVFVIGADGDALAAFKRAYLASDLAAWPCARLRAPDPEDADWTRFLDAAALERLVSAPHTGERPARPELTAREATRYLAHVSAWRRIAACGKRWGLVFEDAARPAPDTKRRLARAMRERDWDVLLLDGGPLALRAYAITADAAAQLADDALPLSQPLEWDLGDRVAAGELAAYAA